ncbi:MAG: CCA tRNA nucleotidyltransferase [Elusimicrobia bacterium]|nr:CCA tRNA nucleotidyltransferase [Elusimicrobiota bacterium]
MLKEINEVINLAKETNTEVYIVGGYIRDFLLKKKSLDIDLVVSEKPESFAKQLAKKIKGKSFILHSDLQVYRVAVMNNSDLEYIDVSLMQDKNIKTDLSKRDFTINALAVKIEKFDNIKKNIIDFFGGIKDLKNKEIKVVSKKVFIDDPLRMLRAFRFASEYKFKISKETLSLIKKCSSRISATAGERIKNELFRILNNKKSSQYISVIDDIKLLEKIFPVITKMKQSAQSFYYHPKGLFQHCFQTYEALENILIKLNKYFPKSKDILEKHLNETFSENVTRKNLLKFIAIFHDCAKPECAKRMDNKMRFLGHEALGARKTAQIMKELKMSNKEIDFAKAIISEHMRPSNLAKSDVITTRAQMRLFRDIKENTPDLLILAMSDWHSYKNLKKKIYPKKVLKQQEKSVAKLIFSYFDFINNKPKDKIVDGNILMKEFHLKPGKIIGELLKYINNAYEEGRIKDKKQALKFAKSQLTVLKKKHRII